MYSEVLSEVLYLLEILKGKQFDDNLIAPKLQVFLSIQDNNADLFMLAPFDVIYTLELKVLDSINKQFIRTHDKIFIICQYTNNIIYY